MDSMPAAWRLAINSLAGRRLRTGLLVAAVALSAGLIVAISCGVASLNAALANRIAGTIGVTDVRVTRAGDGAFGDDVLAVVTSWPGVRDALPRSVGPVNLAIGDTVTLAIGSGVDLDIEFTARPLKLIAGREPRTPDEIAIEERIAEELDLKPGDTVVNASYFGGPPEFTVVGVIERSAFWTLTRPGAVLDRNTLSEAIGEPRRIRSIDLILEDDVDPLAFAATHVNDLDPSLLVQATERITSGIDQNLRSQQIGLLVISIIGFIAAAFIILTGLMTNVIERQRELAIVRSIGGSRTQIALAQLIVGVVIGGLGALFGTPFGIAVAQIGVLIFREHLQAGLVVPPLGVTLASVGAVTTGAAGAVWPAVMASRVSPLQALTARARKPQRRSIVLSLVVGAALITGQFSVITTASSSDWMFWSYILGGVQGMFIGYFLLGAPLVLLISRLLGSAIAAITRTPASLLTGAIRATPFRYGMTAASLMVGLAMMVVIWTSGGAVVKQWLGAIEFPDAFVHGWLGMTEADRERIAALPFVENTNAITILEVDDDGAFGVTGVHNVGTTFVAFEPGPFFSMTAIRWIEGDPIEAQRRLEEGSAVLVAQEFRIAKGIGVGDTFTVRYSDRPVEFEIVGVIASPGLEIVSRYFDIGKLYRHQAISAVFGSRRDLLEKFDVDTVQIVQIDLSDDISDEDAIAELRGRFAGTTLSVGSGREIKRTISTIANGSFLIVSSVAVTAILIACLGVGNVIVAGIEARRFEFGVLRSIGAEGALLGRLVLGEAIVMALAAAILGTLLGLQGAANELRLYRRLAGLDLDLTPPIGPIAAGWLIVFVLTIGAALPSAWRLARRTPRDLLSLGE